MTLDRLSGWLSEREPSVKRGKREERQTSEMNPEGSLSWDDGVPFV